MFIYINIEDGQIILRDIIKNKKKRRRIIFMRGKRKRQRKRITALLLAVIMLFFIMPGQSIKVYADENNATDSDADIEIEAIDTENDLANESVTEETRTQETVNTEAEDMIEDEDILAFAAGPTITAEDYTLNEEGAYEILIDPEKSAEYTGITSVTVPSNYRLTIIDVDFSAGTVSLASDSLLNIFNDNGRLTATINAEEGARIMLTSAANIPQGVTLYDSDGSVFNNDDIFWTEFIYTDNKWTIVQPDPNHFNFGADGLIVDTENGAHYLSYKIEYSYDNGTWYNAFADDARANLDADGFVTISEGHEDNAFLDFDIENIPDPWNNSVTFKITTKDTPIKAGNATKIIAYADLAPDMGWEPGEEGVVQLPNDEHEATLSEDATTLTVTYNDVNNFDAEPHCIRLAMTYPQEGKREIEGAINSRIYAYSVNGSTTTVGGTPFANANDAEKYALALELYMQFFNVEMYGSFDIPQSDEHGRSNYVNIKELVNELKGRIAFKETGTPITVHNNDGTEGQRTVNIYTLNLGYDETGEPVVMDIPVIHLESPDELIICTDFDFETGKGTTYYSRVKGIDEVSFSNDDRNIAMLITSNQITNIVIGGNGTLTQTLNTDEIYSAELYCMAEFYYDENMPLYDPYDTDEQRQAYKNVCLDLQIGPAASKLRILDANNKYLILNGEGETKEYDRLGGSESNPIDNVWAAGEGATAYVYIGDATVYIEPLNANLDLAGSGIKDVTLKDASLKDGVNIDKSNTDKIKITFGSNFYDSVPLIITYSDGEEREFIINRIGLVIQYIYLMDVGNQAIRCDCNGSECSFDCDYEGKDEQILVYATYYHPTNDNTLSGGNNVYLNIIYDDGNCEIISSVNKERNFNGYAPATDDGVATTSFIIGFAPAHDSNGPIASQLYKNKFGNTGGFSATVINAGYDDDKTYGGTQIGAGAGVHWDGHIKWFAR